MYYITILISMYYIKNAVIIAHSSYICAIITAIQMKIAQNSKKCAILFGFSKVRACVCACVFALNGMHTYKIHKYNKSVQFAQI